MIYDWKAIIEQDEKKTFDFFHLMEKALPICKSTIKLDNTTYEELIFKVCQTPVNIEELIKDAKQTV